MSVLRFTMVIMIVFLFAFRAGAGGPSGFSKARSASTVPSL
jgi:hypothetical protein